MPGCNPYKWLWGLLPTLLIALIVIAGEGPKIERDLTKRATEALKQRGHSWANITFSGREAVLTGTAFSPAERSQAVDTVSRIRGAGTVQDRADLLPAAAPYTWWATREDGTIKIKGHVPSEADKQTILGIVKATMPDLVIDDRMKLASGAPPKQRWLGAISFALNQLGPLKKGSARLSDMQLDIGGEADSEATYHAVRNALAAQLPDGLTLSQAAVVPPIAKPYSWAVLRKGGKVTLTGHVPSDKLRGRLLNSVKKAFAGAVVEDSMTLGSGEPEGWPNVIQVAVDQLSRLDEGEVTVQGTALTIIGVAADKTTATDVVQTLRNSLPPSFKSEEKVRVRKAQDPSEQPATAPDGKAEKTMARPPRTDDGAAPRLVPWAPDNGTSGLAKDRDADTAPGRRS